MKSNNFKVSHGNKIVKVAIELVLALFCLFLKKILMCDIYCIFFPEKISQNGF